MATAPFKLSTDERAECLGILAREERLDTHRYNRPSDFYRPHARGQRQFHQSQHIVRCLFPGNGFGKTTAAGCEVNWWLTYAHPWQKIPKRPLIIIWCCETYKQFKILRAQLESECFDRPYRFNKVDNVYTVPGPHGDSQLFLVSGDSSWTNIQGINPDLVVFDEQPPEALWNEMKMRRRGLRKTRYIFAATATQGMTWMYRDLYLPWLEHHRKAMHVSEQEAMKFQGHPTTWVWAKGGIHDNPGCADDVAYYHGLKFNSEAERQVRLGGGFADFSGTPVFDLVALEKQAAHIQEGEGGHFAYVPPINPDDPRCVIRTERGRATKGLLVWSGEQLDDFRGRVTLFKRPIPGHKYVIGHDSAYGLATGDYDAAVVLDRETGEQVAEACGHWGDAMWAEVLFALAWMFNQAFLLGERQVGLMVMRRLYDEMGYSYQYFRRDEGKRSRRQSDDLGHHRTAGDLTIPRLRTAIGRRDHKGNLSLPEVRIRSAELHRQCVKFQFRSKKKTLELHEAHDSDLEYGAPTGDHDDLVFAFGYAQMAMHEVARYQEPEVSFPDGSAGQLFGLAAILHPKPAKAKDDPWEEPL
jgi:hypothetical protein